MKRIALLGSTGSIGTQALEVIALHEDRFQVAALVARSSREALFAQVRRFRPLLAGLTGDGISMADIPDDLRFCRWVFGPEALTEAAGMAECDEVIVAVVGMCGLESVLHALSRGRRVLLANKETLVAGGQLVMKAAKAAGENMLLPIDSEHSAIFQCLQSAAGNPFYRILLTCSGGPFRTWSKQQIDAATAKEALRHPTWSMGAKITVDSATLFNKALEMIEAHYLFGAAVEEIQVIIHPQSVVHSAVEFKDGAVIAQLGAPDMRLPILYAMAYPQRLTTGGEPMDLFALKELTFERPDELRFPSLRLAAECIRAGGAACCILNAANEEAVGRLLRGELTVGRLYQAVEETLQTVGSLPAGSLEQVLEAERVAREAARAIMGSL